MFTITRPELSTRWGLTAGSLQNYATKGKGPKPYHRSGPKQEVFYLLADVVAWESENVDALNASVPGARLSIEPLLREFRLRDIATEGEHLTLRQTNAIKKGKGLGYLNLAAADDLSCRVLRMHPFEVWGAEYEEKVWHDIDGGDPEPLAVAA